jgi:hypothetical protein
MNLREIAAKKLTEILLGQCEDEYRAMYHNGSLRGTWADITDDREQEDYYFYQGEEISDMIRNLVDEIKETWGLEFKIYSYGRGGATFAPDGFSNCGNGHHFNNTLDPDKIVDTWRMPDPMLEGEDFGEWTEAYKTAKDHLAAFKLINERVRAAAAMDMAQWWEETKEGCELTYGDEDEDEDQEFDEAVNG